MKYIAVLLVVGLAGCAIEPKVVASSPRSVMVEHHVQEPERAFALAEQECAKHGMHASFKYSQSAAPTQSIFDCVR
jgi:hypothetical protein